MQPINKLMMLQLAVTDMSKAKKFYSETLGLNITADYRQDDNNWWVSVELPQGGITITLSTHHDHMKPGAATLYFGSSDISAAHKTLGDKGIEVSEILNDLHGPGSNVSFFTLKDTEGNLIHIEQA